MFRQIIYTHSKQGINLRTGKKYTGIGFKTYTCDDSILHKKGILFIENAISLRAPFSQPDLMDDAYFYFHNEIDNEAIFINFYPFMPKSLDGQGGTWYGKYINHGLMGDFSNYYPAELIGSKFVWDAKERGLDFYYDNPPAQPKIKENLFKNDEGHNYNSIRKFIDAGRKDMLVGSVSFLIEQFEKPIEERKYLVILDKSTENIEKWIAAIGYAFSPRIAASISFATRLEKFEIMNQYTINENGQFQLGISNKDTKKNVRYNAMIVGVHADDKTNKNTLIESKNAPYIILDGINKNINIKPLENSFFLSLRNFDERHQKFSSEFLQMYNINKPCRDVYNLFDTYTEFLAIDKIEASRIIQFLDSLVAKNPYEEIYQRISDSILNMYSKFMRNAPNNAFELLKWIQHKRSKIYSIAEHEKCFHVALADEFTHRIYHQLGEAETIKMWNFIKASGFGESISKEILKKINALRLTRQEALKYASFYYDWVSLSKWYEEKSYRNISKLAIIACYEEKQGSIEKANDIVSRLHYNANELQDFMIDVAKECNSEATKFIIDRLLDASINKSILFDNHSAYALSKKLKNAELYDEAIRIFLMRLHSITNSIDELSVLLTVFDKLSWLGDNQRTKLKESIESQAKRIIDGLIKVEEIYTSTDTIESICRKIYILNIGELANDLTYNLLLKRCDFLYDDNYEEWCHFIKMIQNLPLGNREHKEAIYNNLDKRINIHDENAINVAILLLNVSLSHYNSLHLYALSLIIYKHEDEELLNGLTVLRNNGFPRYHVKSYIDKFISQFLNVLFEENIHYLIINLLFSDDESPYFVAYVRKLIQAAESYPEHWCRMIDYPLRSMLSEDVYDFIKNIILFHISSEKNPEKRVSKLMNLLVSDEQKKYLSEIVSFEPPEQRPSFIKKIVRKFRRSE